ncbi:MAG TPA: hypothetical protein VFG76_07415, partial [Candidatus Polarisedimenticolia bacterium]|nr:hypothetical protein [Candidatus Polarisedimenticolia bacterium]
MVPAENRPAEEGSLEEARELGLAARCAALVGVIDEDPTLVPQDRQNRAPSGRLLEHTGQLVTRT